MLTLSLLFPISAFCADVATLSAVCAACHGPDGNSTNETVPSLAGQAYTLIEDNLLAFRDEPNACINSELLQAEAAALLSAMCSLVANLQDDDISALAEFYESQPFTPAQQSFEPLLASDGAKIHLEANCEQRHSQGGRETNGMAAILAGQWTPYLQSALMRIRAGEKKGPKVMNMAVKELSDSDIAALLNFYASESQTPE